MMAIGVQSPPVLAVEGAVKSFAVGRGRSRGVLTAVNDVSLTIRSGETYALVGESGCGKSTLARVAAALLPLDRGDIAWSGEQIIGRNRRGLRALRHHTQLVFQDPTAALSPRMTVGDSIREPLLIQGQPVDTRVDDLLEAVGLDRRFADRYPRELSGGQRQRVVIARALALEPRLLVLDEPVASLDVSVQAQVLNLVADLQEQRGFGALMIAHDLAVVSSVADRIGVMYLGEIVEEGDAAEILANPRHPYTKMLVEAVPAFSPHDRRDRTFDQAEPAVPWAGQLGCSFATRCPIATFECTTERPPVRLISGALVACRHAD